MKRVFLGGTCNKSTWRGELIPMLNTQAVTYFDPVVKDWTPECQARELLERIQCDIVLYTITPNMTGVYSIAEVVDDSNKRPEKTIFCLLREYDDKSFDEFQMKSLYAVASLVKRNGGRVFHDLIDVAKYINSL